MTVVGGARGQSRTTNKKETMGGEKCHEIYAARLCDDGRRARPDINLQVPRIPMDHGHRKIFEYFVWCFRGHGSAEVSWFRLPGSMPRSELAKPQVTAQTVDARSALAVHKTPTRPLRDVVGTHLKYDNAGNFDAFPMRGFISRIAREMSYATGRGMLHGPCGHPPFSVEAVDRF